jgi:hypothetical protein
MTVKQKLNEFVWLFLAILLRMDQLEKIGRAAAVNTTASLRTAAQLHSRLGGQARLCVWAAFVPRKASSFT